MSEAMENITAVHEAHKREIAHLHSSANQQCDHINISPYPFPRLHSLQPNGRLIVYSTPFRRGTVRLGNCRSSFLTWRETNTPN